jgi:hypothetical protein
LYQICKCQFAANLIEQFAVNLIEQFAVSLVNAASLMNASMLMQIEKIRLAASCHMKQLASSL